MHRRAGVRLRENLISHTYGKFYNHNINNVHLITCGASRVVENSVHLFKQISFHIYAFSILYALSAAIFQNEKSTFGIFAHL